MHSENGTMNRFEVQLSNQVWVEINVTYNLTIGTVIEKIKNGAWYASEHGGYINPAHIMQVRQMDA